MPQPLILASQSPRRIALLTDAGVVFEVVDAPVNEFTPATAPQWNPPTLAENNAWLKASAALLPGRWILGADTVVARDGRIFGKPGSPNEAREFLRALSGGVHEVITGCALAGPNGEKIIFHEITRVIFHELGEGIITRYLDEVHVLDKAGAYGLQERGEMLVESVEGSRSNVIGLPVERLLPLLRERGLA
jgi:septum formation protein